MRETLAVWEQVAHCTGILRGMSSSTHAELHLLRAGLAAFLFGLVERGARDAKHASVSSGAAVKARCTASVRLVLRVSKPPRDGSFSCLVPRHVAEQLVAHGATAAQVAVVLRERAGVRVQPTVGDVAGAWRPLDEKAKQGGTRSCEFWSHTIAGPLHAAQDDI